MHDKIRAFGGNNPSFNKTFDLYGLPDILYRMPLPVLDLFFSGTVGIRAPDAFG